MNNGVTLTPKTKTKNSSQLEQICEIWQLHYFGNLSTF